MSHKNGSFLTAPLRSWYPDSSSPHSFSRQGDEAGDRVSEGEMKHEIMNIGSCPKQSYVRLWQLLFHCVKGFLNPFDRGEITISGQINCNSQFREFDFLHLKRIFWTWPDVRILITIMCFLQDPSICNHSNWRKRELKFFICLKFMFKNSFTKAHHHISYDIQRVPEVKYLKILCRKMHWKIVFTES